MTDYTPAKDRLLVALAAYHKDSGDHWTQKAARAVLEEKVPKPVRDSVLVPVRDYERFKALEAENADLKRRVERVKQALLTLPFRYEEKRGPTVIDSRALVDILEGKAKP